MHEITRENAVPLFHRFLYDPVMLHSALVDRSSRFFVNNLITPTAAIACPSTVISFLSGKTVEHACALLAEVLAIAEQPPVLRYISLPVTAWSPIICAQFGYRFAMIERVAFTFDAILWQMLAQQLQPLPGDILVRQIDQDLAPYCQGD